MTDRAALEAVIAQYQKFGWRLRRVLSTAKNSDAVLLFVSERFPDVSIEQNKLDALWFSRTNRSAETWELRRLSGPPFALVQVIDANTPENERDQILRSVEDRMAETPEKSFGEIPLEK
jgi:hypothetical protein